MISQSDQTLHAKDTRWAAIFRQTALLIVLLALAISFTLMTVEKSKAVGRLAATPGYDDIVYFVSAGEWLVIAKTSGLGEMISTIFKKGAHSPYSSILALIAFSIGGIHEVAAYYANVLVIIAYLFGVRYFMRELPVLVQMGGMMFFLGVPFTSLCVTQFRPDLMWAVVLGFTSIYTITAHNLFENGRRTLFISGLLYGFIILIKPSTFALTLLVAAIVFAIRGLADLTISKVPLRRFVLAGVPFILGLLAGCGWYVIRAGGQMWDYFYVASFGANKDIWKYGGDAMSHWTFYWSYHGCPVN